MRGAALAALLVVGLAPLRAAAQESVAEAGLRDGGVADAGAADAGPPPRRHVRIAVAGNAPFVIEQPDGSLGGMSVEAWEDVAEALRIDYELTRLDHASDAVSAVRDGRFDGAIGPISITSERARRVGFTQPYQQATLAFLTRPGSSSVWQRISPFISRTFFGGVGVLLAVLLLVGTLVWLVERRANDGVPERAGPGIGVGVWLALVTMTTVGYGDKAPVTVAGRVIVGVWMLIAMISLSSLTAGIATALTLSSLDQASIESADELRSRPVGALEGTTADAFARERGARVRAVADLDSALDELIAGRVDAVVFDRPVLAHYLREHPDLDVVLSAQEYEPQGYGFAFPLESPLRREVDVTLLEMEEDGRLDAIRDRWL